MNSRKKRAVRNGIFAVGLLLAGSPVVAETYTWTSHLNGLWSQAERWSPSTVPNGPTADVFLDDDPLLGVTATLDSDRMVRTLEIGNRDELIFADGSDLTVAGQTIVNRSRVTQNASTTSTSLRVGAPVLTITNNGTWTLSDSPFNRIVALNPGNVLVNDANHTIRGSGTFGAFTDLGLINRGRIEATGTSQIGLTFSLGDGGNASGTFDLVNEGEIDGLQEPMYFVGPLRIDNRNGILSTNYNSTGADIFLDSDVYILGGAIERGRMVIPDGETGVVLEDVTVQNNGHVQVDDAVVSFKGTIGVSEDSSIGLSYGTVLEVDDTGLMFEGDGALGGQGLPTIGTCRIANADGPSGSGRVVSLSAGMRWVGDGVFGTNDGVGLVNHGTIKTYPQNYIEIEPGLHTNVWGDYDVVNDGVIEATSGQSGSDSDPATVTFRRARIDNRGGVLTSGHNTTYQGRILLGDETHLYGGTLSEGVLAIETPNDDAVIEDLTIGGSGNAEVQLSVDDELTVLGSLTTISSEFEFGVLDVIGGTVRIGNGGVDLVGNGRFAIGGTYEAGQDIEGRMINGVPTPNRVTIGAEARVTSSRPNRAGRIGNHDRLGIHNLGLMDAGNQGTLYLDPGDEANVQGPIDLLNEGTIRGGRDGFAAANQVAILSGAFLNAGMVEAIDQGQVTISPAVENLSRMDSDLIEGTWRASGEGALVDFGGGVITSIREGAAVEFDGSGSDLVAGGQSLSNTVDYIEGTLRARSGRNLAPFSDVVLPGRLELSASSDYGLLAGSLDLTLSGTSSVSVEIEGTGEEEYSQIRFSGVVTVGGRLEVSVTGGIWPAPGNEYRIVGAGQLIGAFSSVDLPELPGGSWVVDYREDGVVLRVIEATSSVPGSDSDGPADDDLPPVAGTPLETGLTSVSPNPVLASGDGVSVGFGLARDSAVRVTVYALDGRQVATVLDGQRTAGFHDVRWSGRDDGGRNLAAGVYFMRLETSEGVRKARKVVLTGR
ncbi:MAG: T9SS type A sorting domain-containing protein [Candidatus Eisenbacteria bacterium]|uniref:T9SS type A sorting domain-containing protein n=1 Tax=Eiseniibacteriota bacterium TaxID=2212470 RepID=A0A956NAZ7_UNCEI|nr:T9SS type A sorting domain-containing protein [Candidatus Eisenbacteria bacterium]